MERISKKKTKFVTIQMKGGKGRLDVSLLCYVEVRDHDLIYHTVGGDIEAKGTMKDAEEILAGVFSAMYDGVCFADPGLYQMWDDSRLYRR